MSINDKTMTREFVGYCPWNKKGKKKMHEYQAPIAGKHHKTQTSLKNSAGH
jgi:hypothetical protein